MTNISGISSLASMAKLLGRGQAPGQAMAKLPTVAYAMLLAASLASCRMAQLEPIGQAPAQDRLPLKAVVWAFKDATPDRPASRETAPDGSTVFQFNLTRGGSNWRPELDMRLLGRVFAQELQAQLVESAEMVDPAGGSLPMVEEERKGARLFVEGTVEEAVWLRPRAGAGSYRLMATFRATLTSPSAPSIEGFWTKIVVIEAPRRGYPSQDLAALLHQAFSQAVADLKVKLAGSGLEI